MANVKLFRWLLLLLLVTVHIPSTQCYRFQFIEKGSTLPVVMVDADFKITITAFQNKNQIGHKVIQTSDGKDAQITGISDIKSKISAQFNDSINWVFLFEETSGVVSITRLVEFVPSKIFKESTLTNAIQFKHPEETIAGLWTSSYQCDKKVETSYGATMEMTSDITFEVTTSVLNLRAQGYNIIDGTYGNAVHCFGDSSGTTLPSPPATTVPTTLPPTTLPLPGVNKYFVKEKDDEDKFCIEFIGKLEFEIDYLALDEKKETVNKTAKVVIPKKFTASGYCKANPQRLIVNFHKDWFLTVLFLDSQPQINKPSSFIMMDSLATDSKKNKKASACYISNITLSYSMNKDWFPNATDDAKTRYVLKVEGKDVAGLPSKTSNEAYYKCDKVTSVTLGRGAKLHMSQVKFKAFNEDSDPTFKGEPSKCAADQESGSDSWATFGYVMMVVGLLVILIVVSIAIARHQRNKKAGYNSI